MLFIVSLLAIPLISLSSQASGCPGMEKASEKYLLENFVDADENEKLQSIIQKHIRINSMVCALQFTMPGDSEEKTTHKQTFTVFFSGKTSYEFVQQVDGEITEIMNAKEIRFVFVTTESNDGEERHIDAQVMAVDADGKIDQARDGHGSEIFFSQTRQERCEGKIGDTTTWSRDNANSNLITVRQRHTDRDEACRVTEDASSYRYYRLSGNRWNLDNPEAETIADESEVMLKTPITRKH